jgi:hypothetical protein
MDRHPLLEASSVVVPASASAPTSAPVRGPRALGRRQRLVAWICILSLMPIASGSLSGCGAMFENSQRIFENKNNPVVYYPVYVIERITEFVMVIPTLIWMGIWYLCGGSDAPEKPGEFPWRLAPMSFAIMITGIAVGLIPYMLTFWAFPEKDDGRPSVTPFGA